MPRRWVVNALAARRCAQAIDVPVIGTVGVALRAKRFGLVASGRATIEELRRAGLYVSEDLVAEALARLGE